MNPPAIAVIEYRERLRIRGLKRLEVHVRDDDAPLVRAVAIALADPDRAAAARIVLLRHFGPAPTRDLKALLEAAPLDGLDLERPRDAGRRVDL